MSPRLHSPASSCYWNKFPGHSLFFCSECNFFLLSLGPGPYFPLVPAVSTVIPVRYLLISFPLPPHLLFLSLILQHIKYIFPFYFSSISWFFFSHSLALMGYLCLHVCGFLLLMLSGCLQFLGVPPSNHIPGAAAAWAGAPAGVRTLVCRSTLAAGEWIRRSAGPVMAGRGGDAESSPNPWGQGSSKDLTNPLCVVDLGFCLPASLEAR